MPATEYYTPGGLPYTVARSRRRMRGRHWVSLLVFVVLLVAIELVVVNVLRSSTDSAALPKLADERQALEEGMPRNPIGTSRFLVLDPAATWTFAPTGSCTDDPLAGSRATVLRRFVTGAGQPTGALTVVAASFRNADAASKALDGLRRLQVTCTVEAVPATPLAQLDRGPVADESSVVVVRPGGGSEVSVVGFARNGRWVVWASTVSTDEARAAVSRLLDTVATIDRQLRD